MGRDQLENVPTVIYFHIGNYFTFTVFFRPLEMFGLV